MTVRKMNCWEYKGCGREPGGRRADELGVCPAAEDRSYDGLHGGENAGRACWMVAGTMCRGEVQGTFAKKYRDCALCDFYMLVRTEEGLGSFRSITKRETLGRALAPTT